MGQATRTQAGPNADLALNSSPHGSRTDVATRLRDRRVRSKPGPWNEGLPHLASAARVPQSCAWIVEVCPCKRGRSEVRYLHKPT
jgi:hypothetical protein